MADIPALLLSAIEETERLAREAAATGAGPDWRFVPCDGGQCEGHLLPDGRSRELIACYPYEGGGMYEPIGPHIAHNDPASVLGRCAADRKLIALHPKGANGLGGPSCLCCEERTDYGHSDGEWPCDTLKALAEGYGVPIEGDET
jgi:hypothetical protein